MHLDKIKKLPQYHKQIVPYPKSRFEYGHVSVTEGNNDRPVCMLPLSEADHTYASQRTIRNAEMIRRLPDLLSVVVEILIAENINQDHLKEIQTRFKKILK